jgi:tetratricopeptide (TPR) repeat protein
LNSILAAVNEDPEKFEYQIELGRQYNDAARYSDAVQSLRKAVALRANDLEALASLGLALFESAQYDEAISILEKANRLSPGNYAIQEFLRVTRVRQAGVPQIPDMREMAKAEPDNVGIRIQLIDLLTFTGRLNDAETYIEQVWKLAPKDARPYIKIALAYEAAGMADRALDAFQRGLVVREDFGLFMNLASLYAKLGEYEKASRAYDKALELKPEASGIMFFYANMLRDHGKRQEALDMYKRSLALNAVNGPALFNAAVLSAKLGDMTSAQQYLTGLKSIDPQLARKVERYFTLRLWL